VKDGDDYTHIGYVGTGLKDNELRRLTNQLKAIVEKYESDEWFFLPRVVLEMRADLVSQDKDGNYSLRFPRVHRIRDDKFPADINTMDDLIGLS
jgi:ATP-dependent DNA ligase